MLKVEEKKHIREQHNMQEGWVDGILPTAMVSLE